MPQHTSRKEVTETWTYSAEDIERLIREDIAGRDVESRRQIDVVFDVGQGLRGATVTHRYIERSKP